MSLEIFWENYILKSVKIVKLVGDLEKTYCKNVYLNNLWILENFIILLISNMFWNLDHEHIL